MTDKLIDGINVAECEFCNEYKGCDIYSMTCDYSNICKQNKECFIKKILLELKHKEQECEALGQAYLETNELLQEKTKECTNLKAENEKLRQYKGSKQASYETMQKECNEAKNEVNQLKAENKKLKEKLDDFEFMYDSLSK